MRFESAESRVTFGWETSDDGGMGELRSSHWPRKSFKTRIAIGAGTRRDTASSLSIRTIRTSSVRSGTHWRPFPTPRPRPWLTSAVALARSCPTWPRRFNRVIALDFAPAMLKFAAGRLEPEALARVTFLKRPMHELDDLAGQIDVAVAVNSLVMPDVRLIDRTLLSIRASLKPGGVFLGVVPSIDTICYHLSLLMDQALDQGLEPREAKRLAALHTERRHYDFAFGEFHFDGLRQKFWQPFEIEYRLKKAGFGSTTLDKVLYPWDESVAGSDTLAGFPRNWDWFFQAYA